MLWVFFPPLLPRRFRLFRIPNTLLRMSPDKQYEIKMIFLLLVSYKRTFLFFLKNCVIYFPSTSWCILVQKSRNLSWKPRKHTAKIYILGCNFLATSFITNSILENIPLITNYCLCENFLVTHMAVLCQSSSQDIFSRLHQGIQESSHQVKSNLDPQSQGLQSDTGQIAAVHLSFT